MSSTAEMLSSSQLTEQRSVTAQPLKSRVIQTIWLDTALICINESSDTAGTSINFSLLYTYRKCLAHFFLKYIIYIFCLNICMALWLTSYYHTLITETQKAILALLHIHQETLCSRANQDKAGSRQDKVWCPPLLSLLWLWKLSPLMFGHNVSSVHHCHTRPAQLLRGYICVKLSHHRAVIWRHTAPRPVVRDPGVSKALPHYHAVACGWKRHKEMGSQQTCGTACRLDNVPNDLHSEVNFDLTKAAITCIKLSGTQAVAEVATGLHSS